MIGKPLCLLAAALVAVAAPLALASAQSGGGARNDATEFSAKKKKGKGTTQTTQQQDYMIIRMEEVTVTGRKAPRKTVPSAGILGWPMGLNQNPPSATGTPIAPPPPRGGVIR